MRNTKLILAMLVGCTVLSGAAFAQDAAPAPAKAPSAATHHAAAHKQTAKNTTHKKTHHKKAPKTTKAANK